MDYEKEKILIELNDEQKDFQLIQSITKTKNDLNKAHLNFEFAEEELIDFYTYQIKALQSKLDYLIKIAKLKNLNFDVLNEEVV